MGQTIGENEPGRSFVDKLLRDKREGEIEEAAEKYCIEWHNTYTDGMTVANYCNAEMPGTCFIAGAKHMQPKIEELEGKLKVVKKYLKDISSCPHWDLCSGLQSMTASKVDLTKCDCHVRDAREALEKIGESNGKE